MYEKIAWDHFMNTGNLESFLEYKRLLTLQNELQQDQEQIVKKNVGVLLDEINKGQGDSNQRNTL